MDWEINYNGVHAASSDLTMADCVALEGLTDTAWFAIDPCWRAAHIVIVTAYLVSQATGRPYAEVVAEIGKVNADVFIREHVTRKPTPPPAGD